MIDNIYVVATAELNIPKKLNIRRKTKNWSGIVQADVEHFYTPHRALKRISEIAIENGFTKPDPEDDPKQYLYDYEDYLVENDIIPEINISLHTINLGEELSMDRNYYQQNYKSI